MPEQRPNPRELGFYVALSQVGLEMVVPVLVGWALDHWLDWRPWGVIVGAVLGLVVGITHLVVLVDHHQKKKSSGNDPQ